MKKLILLLAGIALMFVSCDSSSNNNIQIQQAQIDSVAKAKETLQDAINQKKNDSTINALATAKADSIEKAGAKNAAHTGDVKATAKDAAPPPAK